MGELELIIKKMRNAEKLLASAKCDVCGQPAANAEIANGTVYGAVCDNCMDEHLEDADEFLSWKSIN